VPPSSGVSDGPKALAAIVNGASLTHQNSIARFGKPVTPAARPTLLATTSRAGIDTALT
jgi:hypothetical protein